MTSSGSFCSASGEEDVGEHEERAAGGLGVVHRAASGGSVEAALGEFELRRARDSKASVCEGSEGEECRVVGMEPIRHPVNVWLGPGLKTRLLEGPKSIELEPLG